MTRREIRRAAKCSQARAAVLAGVSEPTLRLFEAAPGAVSPDKRRVLEAFYAQLARDTAARVSS
jgi:hypothetical protein